MNRRILITLTAAVALCAQAAVAAPKHSPSPKPAPASKGSPSPSPSSSPGAPGFTFSDWQVSTSQFHYNWQSGAFVAPQHITLTRTGSDIQADRAQGNQKTKQATLTGNVVLHDTNGVLSNFSGGTSAPSHKPATLTCNNLQIDGVTKTYTATGNVHFTQGTSIVTADRAIMNGATHDLHLFGNVHLTQ